MCLIYLILLSCVESSNKEYYKSGNLKTNHFYSKKGELDSLVNYFDSEKAQPRKIISKYNDSLSYIITYNSKGRMISEGYINKDSIKLGKWYLYKDDTTEVFEFKEIRGDQYLNQSWVKNSNGDTISGNYFHLKKTKDSVKVNDIVTFKFYLEGFILSPNSELIFLYPKDDKNFDENFSNEFILKKDTIRSLKYTDVNYNLEQLPLNHMLMVNFQFESSGRKKIRGILTEINKIQEDSFKLEERKIYFDQYIYVE